MTTNNTESIRNVQVTSSTRNGSLLETKYYCVAKNRKVDVVMELQTSDKLKQSSLPQRYVLVIDVSGSMDNSITAEDTRSLLERMKNFAHLFINNVSSETFLSIVDFADEARILLPMMEMNDTNKIKAQEIITNLEVRGVTNLSDALFKALEVTEWHQKSYDCIILFTDGEANRGIEEPDDLIKEFKNKLESLNKINQVQIATVTIGEYQPYLLKEISRRLSSDAFYWLNLECDFEADMLIPKFLREQTCITDITIDLTCLNGVTIVEGSESSSGMQEKHENHGMRYFVYNLPRDVKKRITFSLDISQIKEKEKYMLKINKSFLDHELVKQHDIDHLELSLVSMKDARPSEQNIPNANKERMDYLENISAYVCSKNILLTSWNQAQMSYANVMEQHCRQLTISAVSQTILHLETKNMLESYPFEEAVDEITKIKVEAAIVLEKRSPHCKTLIKNVDGFVENLKFSKENQLILNWARLSAMESSLNMEMPAATGVFCPEIPQSFMPPQVEKKLVECAKIVNRQSGRSKNEAASRLEAEYERRKKISFSHQKLLDAMHCRDAHALSEALHLCRGHGVDQEEIEDGEALLVVVQEEDKLIQEIKELMKQKNISKIKTAIHYFKSHVPQFVDKSEDFEEAEALLKELLEKEKLQQALEATQKRYKVALQTKNVDLMKEMIEHLENLAAKGVVLNESLIREAKADLQRICTELKKREQMNEIKEEISKSYQNEDLASLKDWIEQMTDLLKDKNLVKTDEDDEFLKCSMTNMHKLSKKQSIQKDLQMLRSLLSLPQIPDSLEKLIDGVSQIKQLKQDADGLHGAFTTKDEDFLTSVCNNVEVLQSNIEKRNNARQRLQIAFEGRNYNDLVEAIKVVDNAPFTEENETKDAKDLAEFIDPELRSEALKVALKSSDISMISSAIEDFEYANVNNGEVLLQKAQTQLEKLNKEKELENIIKKCKKAIKNRNETITEEMIKALEDLAKGGFKFNKKIITGFKADLQKIQSENVQRRELEKIYGGRKKK